MSIKKGFLVDREIREYFEIFDALRIKLKVRHTDKRKNFRKSIYFVIQEAREWKTRYKLAMKHLPKRFDSNYDKFDYISDIRHIKCYYSRFNHEDWWKTKASLKRVKSYERREGVQHFLDRELAEKKEI